MTALQRFRRLFPGLEDAYGQYDCPEKGTTTVKRATPKAAWERHFKGTAAGLGIPPLRRDGTVRFAVLDLDDDNTDHATLARKVEDLGLPLVVCRSKSGGAHLYVFFTEDVRAELVRKKQQKFSEALGLKNPDGRPIEIFPKQSTLKVSSYGNWINLPYYGGDDTTRYAVGPAGECLDLDHFLAYAEGKAITADELKAWTTKVEDNGLDFSDGPLCLNIAVQAGFPGGSRNDTLFSLAVYLKQKYPGDWQERALKINSTHIELDEQEAEGTVQSVERAGSYSYKPGLPGCCLGPGNADLRLACEKRTYGCKAARVAAVAAQAAHDLPIVYVHKLLTWPPLWTIGIERGGEITKVDGLATDDIYNYTRLAKAVLERCNIVLPGNARKGWHTLLGALLVNVKQTDAPEDASPLGMLRSHLEDFLDRRKQAHDREDLLRELPVEEDGVCLFRAQDLTAHLDRRGFRLFPTPSKLWAALKALGPRAGSGSSSRGPWSACGGSRPQQRHSLKSSPAGAMMIRRSRSGAGGVGRGPEVRHLSSPVYIRTTRKSAGVPYFHCSQRLFLFFSIYTVTPSPPSPPVGHHTQRAPEPHGSPDNYHHPRAGARDTPLTPILCYPRCYPMQEPRALMPFSTDYGSGDTSTERFSMPETEAFP